MKYRFLVPAFALLAAASAHAQIFRPGLERMNGSHARGATSVVVGMGPAPLAHRGAWGGHHWHGHRGHHGPTFGYVYSPRVYYPSYGYYPVYGYYDGYGAGYPYYGSYGTSGAASGLLLGALAGGIIGNNSGSLHHDAWRGAAWGAGAGWLLGTIADANRRPAIQDAPAAAPVVAAPAAPVLPAPTTSASGPQQVTIINHYYATPMSQANGLFGR